MVPTKRVVSEQDAAVIVPSSTKKRKTMDGGASSKKWRRGKPSDELCQLNLDVLHLIAEYIHPRDLLNLARTCKSLRELLMDKSSKFVWKAARGQVSGLPDCPADLTEPGYANLVFHARCHGCGKYAKKILWRMRRRYCPECRVTRLRKYTSCDMIGRVHHAIIVEDLMVKGEKCLWVDREQLESYLQEYQRSSNKDQFIAERRNELSILLSHASDCESWEQTAASDRKCTLDSLRQEREDGILERLKQQGYGPEIAYHGRGPLYACCASFFKVAKPLTDKEWAWMLPKWTESMKSLRAQRIDMVVYQPRRELLASEYANYVNHPSPDDPVFDLLPHLTELLQFPPFRDIIHAPEGAELGQKPFKSAFKQLPDLVEKWREQLDTQLAELVKIPSNGQSSAGLECSQVSTNKLRLACAMFEAGATMARYPDVFSNMDPICGADLECTTSIRDRFGVSFLEVAPSIVKTCGLNPNVATVEDMDRRNARLKCMWCKDRFLMPWRNAIHHARFCTQYGKSSRWEIVDDKHIAKIQAIEPKVEKDVTGSARCLLCRPCVGDSMAKCMVISHLVHCHGIEEVAIKRDVHYVIVHECILYDLARIQLSGEKW